MTYGNFYVALTTKYDIDIFQLIIFIYMLLDYGFHEKLRLVVTILHHHGYHIVSFPFFLASKRRSECVASLVSPSTILLRACYETILTSNSPAARWVGILTFLPTES